MSGEGDEVMTAVVPQGVEPFHGLEINALARRLEADGRDIAFLEQGQPAAPPAPRVIEAVRAVLDGPQMYTHFAGTPALRDALARYYAEQHGVTVSPDSIVATMGSSSGFILAFLGGFEPGARIAVTRPVNVLSGKAVTVTLAGAPTRTLPACASGMAALTQTVPRPLTSASVCPLASVIPCRTPSVLMTPPTGVRIVTTL